jgi:hypothetical protein
VFLNASFHGFHLICCEICFIVGHEAKERILLQMSSQCKLLALGDSLTQGYYRWGSLEHPYTIRLEALLEERFPGTFTVVNDGIPGTVGRLI